MQNVFEYDVFLSFASKDEDLVRPIWQEMCLSGLRVFWSDETLKQNIGQSFFSVIQNALVQSNHFVLICSTNAMKSRWVEMEYQTFYSECFLRSNGTRRLIIFPIRDFKLSNLPPFLKSLQIAKSAKQMISTLGGIDIQAIKAENIDLQRKLELAHNEGERLQKKLQQKEKLLDASVPKSKWETVQRQLVKEKEKNAAFEQEIRHLNSQLTEAELLKFSPSVELRRKSQQLSVDDVKLMIKEKDFFQKEWNEESKGIAHQYTAIILNGENLIIDRVTGLVWQQSGSFDMNCAEALNYVETLNKEQYAGIGNWRLPTLEEAMSLMEATIHDDLYIDGVFDRKQPSIWTDDMFDGWRAWLVNYKFGTCHTYKVREYVDVRAVRCLKFVI